MDSQTSGLTPKKIGSCSAFISSKPVSGFFFSGKFWHPVGYYK